jgi:DNA-binding transcriptional LysR family regulator
MANSHDVADRVAQGELDLGLVEGPIDDAQLVLRPFLEDRLKLVVSHRHRWHDRDHVSVEDLREEPLVVREPGSGTRMVMESALAQLGIALSQLNVRFVLGTTQAIKAMISQNLGVAILSPYTILPQERADFHLLDISPLRLMRHLSVIHSTEHLQPAAERLIRVVFAMDWPATLG